jgi:hypothetical protein
MIFKNQGPIMGTELKAEDFVTAGDSIVPIEGTVLFELAPRRMSRNELS